MIESAAALAVAEGQFERAALLAGTAVARRHETGSPLPPEEQQDFDDAVAAGKLTAAQATTMKANVKDRVTSMVNNVRSMGMGRGMGMGHEGMGRGGHF